MAIARTKIKQGTANGQIATWNQATQSYEPNAPSNSRVYNEIPTGLINNVNTIFTTAVAFVAGSEEVKLNGIIQTRIDDYTISSTTTITMLVAPEPSDKLLISYNPI
jgi:hypothetical protein